MKAYRDIACPYPLRGSRFVSERLQTPLLWLPYGGNGGLDTLIRWFNVQRTDLTPLHLFNAAP